MLDIKSNKLVFDNDFKSINCAVACSGGKDSNLLIHSLNTVKITPSIIIDHGIRKDSATASLFILTQHQQQKIPCLLFSIDSSQPKNGIQEWARIKRYQLLSLGCKLHNKDYLATAHHLNDQIETLYIRIKRKSKAWGQACMPYLYFKHDIIIWRPFLSISSSQIIRLNKDNPLTEVTDPANTNCNFTRIKVRELLKKSLKTANRLKVIANYRAQQRMRSQTKILAWFSKFVKVDAYGQAWLKPEFNDSNCNNIEARAIHILIQLITASNYGPRWSDFLIWWEKCRNSSKHIESYFVRIQKKSKFWNFSKSAVTNDYIDIIGLWDKRFKFSGSGINFLYSTVIDKDDLHIKNTIIKPDNKLFVIPMAKLFTKALIKEIYGITPEGSGWKTLPIIIRNSKSNPVNQYNSDLLNNNLSLLKSNQQMDYIGCPIAGYDKEALKKRFDINCEFINNINKMPFVYDSNSSFD